MERCKSSGDDITYNPELDKAGRVADFFELGELMMRDALEREESCGGHFREEYQTKEGEARRDDENYTFASTWEFKGVDKPPILHKEDLDFKTVTPTKGVINKMADLKLTLNIWRQKSPKESGSFKSYELNNLNTHMSFLEMLDVLNERLVEEGKEPVALIMTVEKEYVECALWLLMEDRMGRREVLQLVNYTCVILRAVKVLQSSLGGQRHSP